MIVIDYSKSFLLFLNFLNLRFSGFDDDWVKVNIKNYSTIKGRIGWKNLKQSEYTESGPFLIAGKHIYNGIINWEDCDHLTEERYDESPEIALKIGDIIFSKDGSLGNPALIRELPNKATINGTMMLVRLHEKITPNFFYQVLNSNSFFRLLHILKSGSSIPHIFQRDMENFNFNVPPKIEEQNKISNFLEIIDEKIQLLEKKHQSYQDFKKYLMQQIFSQKLRFDFDEDWHTDKIGTKSEVFGRIGFRGYTVDDLVDKGKGALTIGGKHISKNFQLDLSDPEYLSWEKYEESPEIKIYNNDVLLVKTASVGKVCFIENLNEPATLNPQLIVFKNIKLNNKFFYYYLISNLFQKDIHKIKSTTGIPTITQKELLNLDITYPSLEEQEKIVNLLSVVDKKISSIEKSINDIKKFKNGLLQQMFI